MNAAEIPKSQHELTKRIGEITKALAATQVPFADMIGSVLSKDSFQIIRGERRSMNMPVGAATFLGIYKAPHMACGVIEMSAGTFFPPHSHEETEIIACFRGAIEMVIGPASVILSPETDVAVIIPPKRVHHCRVLEDAEVLCVTIPGSSAFPNADWVTGGGDDRQTETGNR